MEAHAGQTARILADLNEPQRRAVTHRDGPLLVLAGPGSGKTRVIARRAAYLVHSGVAARHILAITFTNKAADEMRRRIAALGVGGGMWVCTFHALGARLLRQFGPRGGVRPGFSIYDQADQLRLVKEALERCQLSGRLYRPEAVRSRISAAKNRLESWAAYRARAEHSEQRCIARVYEAYQELLRERNAVDFDDLLMRPAALLRDDAELRRRLNRRFAYLLIDEYQDTNHAQYVIARQFSRHHQNICATGDPDQSIYGWRGADLNNILAFEHDYPEATVVRLEQNYRSTPDILRAAAKLISANRRRKPKELWSGLPGGSPVSVWAFAQGSQEAERVAATVAELRQAGHPYSDFAIFYRVNAISRGLEDALRARAIPYQIARGVEFYNRREIRDVLAYLRVLVNPQDQLALLRIINTPPRGIGATTLARLRRAAERRGRPLIDLLDEPEKVETLDAAALGRLRRFAALLEELRGAVAGPVAEAVSRVLALSGLEQALQREQESGGEDRLANVQELVSAAARYDEQAETPALADFLQRVALTSEQDSVDASAGRVLLMTLHAAKGLEFPVVFIVGLEEGTLPHERVLREQGDLEEERRLCFVGMTRAKQRLYLTHARQRVLRGRPVPRCASRFLHELPDSATVWEDFASAARPGQQAADGLVALDDQAAAAGGRRWPARRRPAAGGWSDEGPCFSPDDPTRVAAARPAPRSAYADWGPGTLVQHEQYGVGKVLWLQPGRGRTRAAIRFAGYGEKTFVLEQAPLRELRRPGSAAR